MLLLLYLALNGLVDNLVKVNLHKRQPEGQFLGHKVCGYGMFS